MIKRLCILYCLICFSLCLYAQEMRIISYNIWDGFEGDSLRRARFVEWTQGVSCRYSSFNRAGRF